MLMSELIFVYGSLRRGASNHFRMKDSEYLGCAQIKGTLIKVDWYPGLLLEGDSWIHGEVYQVEESTLRELDAFEGVGSQNSEYQRIHHEVLLNQQPTKVWVYEWLGGVLDYEILASGDWLLHESD